MGDAVEFRERLRSFDAVNWFGHSEEASPLVCARYGWSNVGFQILKCTTCGAIFPFSQSSDASDVVEKTLIERHGTHCVWRKSSCDAGLTGLKLEPLEEVSKELLRRFDGYRLLWDLPVMDDVTGAPSDDWELLFSFLLDRLCQDLTRTDRDRYDEALRHRVRSIMTLSLMGWTLKWLSKPIYLQPTKDRPFHFTEGGANEPTRSGICYGRQSYLVCDICNAKMGLWSVSSSIGLNVAAFKEVAEKLERTGTPLIGLKRKREEEEKQKTETMLKPSVDRPIFGIRKFKKCDLPSALSSKMRNEDRSDVEEEATMTESECRPVVAGRKLDPIERHRHFCPYRTEWKNVLKALTSN